MNEKEMNQAILAELKRIANEVFAKVKVSKEGTYTAAELWNEKDAFGERIYINYQGTESDIYTAEIGSFKMQVTPQKLWYVLWKFERMCNVKQADKMRFTYGNQEGENISAKTMYLDKEGKAIARKKNLVKLSDSVAIEKDKKTKSYNMYYFASGLWYLVATNYEESQYKTIKERIEKDENYLFGLLQKWDFNTENRLNTIYKALFDALKSERTNNTPEQRKSENEPENTVICNKNNAQIQKLSENIGKDEESRVYVRIKSTWCRLVGFGGHDAENIAEEGERELLYLKSILEDMKNGESGICEQNDKILSMLSEDYPPEPYNKANTDDTGQKIEKCESSCDNQEKKCVVEHVSDIQGKNMRPNYFRQKVFPAELFYARCKISRFKPRYFVGYTNYHLCEESSLERKIDGNTSVYRVLIRGETKNNILTCRKTCFRL